MMARINIMYCHSCGKEIIIKAKFCSYCGIEIPTYEEKNNAFSTILTKKRYMQRPYDSTNDDAISPSKIGVKATKLGLKVAASPITIPLKFTKWGLGIKTKQCPKCDSKKIKVVKPDRVSATKPGITFLFLGPLAFLGKEPKNLNVCRDCSFSWEDR